MIESPEQRSSSILGKQQRDIFKTSNSLTNEAHNGSYGTINITSHLRLSQQIGVLEGSVAGHFVSVDLNDQPPLEARQSSIENKVEKPPPMQEVNNTCCLQLEQQQQQQQVSNRRNEKVVVTVEGNGQQLRNQKKPINVTALLAGVLSSLFFALGVLIVKLLPKSDGVQREAKALFFRGAFMSIICAIVLIYRRGSFAIPKNEIWITSVRSLTGCLRIVTSYLALRYISAGDSVALLFTSAVWTNVLSLFFFNEKLKASQILALPVCFVGILMVANPALLIGTAALVGVGGDGGGTNGTTGEEGTTSELLDISHRWPGVLMALCSALLCSATFIVLKFRKTTPIQTTTFWLGISMAVTAVAMALSNGAQPSDLPQSALEWLLLVLLGAVSWLGQVTMQWALHHERAGLLAILRSLDVPVTFTLGALLLGEHVYWTSMVGAAIIALVVGSLMLKDWLKAASAGEKDDEEACMKERRQQQSTSVKTSSPVVKVSLQQQVIDDREKRKEAELQVTPPSVSSGKVQLFKSV